MSSSSIRSADLSKNLSAKSKEVCGHIVVGVSKRHGTFECDESLGEFMEDQMTPVRVWRCVNPMKSKGHGLGHEYLVMDLGTPEGSQLLIKAEKLYVGMGDPERKPGGLTKVENIANPAKFVKELKELKGKVKCKVDLPGSGKILLKDLLTILGAGNPRYSLWKHNCWKYASDTLKKLLEKLAELPDTSDDCKQKIREALKGMPSPVLPANVLEEAASVFLGGCVFVFLAYGGAVGGIGAYKFIKGLKVAKVIGLGGPTFQLKSAIVSAKASLAKRAWFQSINWAIVFWATGTEVAEGYTSMQQSHGYRPQKDEKRSGI